ncbi:hypothetical protein [Algiphilus sp.]|uniref:hypothetical protein n=1 Tax=Algiphilus sp. TaxID=1872431 RepID=UPI0025C44945|nr:hypothetical protein [Algiphilus sp.]MCK5769041.1 hypothetical protein [Algiphilus sp.]
MRNKYIPSWALLGVAIGLAACSGDPGSPEVHGTVHLASPPSGAATLTVELVPVSAGAGLPIFSLTRALEAGTRDADFVLPYDEGGAFGHRYRLSARVDGPDSLMLGSAEAPVSLDVDGHRASLTVRAP